MGNLQLNRIYFRKWLSSSVGLPLLKADLIELGDHLKNSVNENFDYSFDDSVTDTLIFNFFLKPQNGDNGNQNHLFRIVCSRDSVPSFTIINGDDVFLRTQRNSSIQYWSWAIGLTKYGAVLSLPSRSENSNSTYCSLQSLQCFFTYMRDIEEDSIRTPAIFLWREDNEIGDTSSIENSTAYSIFYQNELSEPTVDALSYRYFAPCTTLATIPVLTPICSKTSMFYAPHLYIKETNSAGCYGHIRLEDTYFLAGCGLCLETGERRE